MEFKKMRYYPVDEDDMWNKEVEKLLPWIDGKGADIGCGDRTIDNSILTVDCDIKRKPSVVAKGDKLPFKNGELDFIVSIHNLEHYDNQREVLDEWRRVVKSGGVIAIVHPDVDYTGIQAESQYNTDKNKFNKHYHERNEVDFHRWFLAQKFDDLVIIDSGPACREWSFYLIIEKK